jgi:myo-inositol-1(or 4)-monophosphatase
MVMYPDVETIAHEAGELAMRHFRALATVPVESKGHLDLVTAADREVEAFVIQRLQQTYPDDGVFGEEGGAVSSRSGRIWVVDPIDGTFNFVRGGDQWAVSIGLHEGGKPTFGVLNLPARGQFIMGGEGCSPTINGTPLAPRVGFDPSRAATGVGFHPVIPSAQRLEVLRFLIDDARMMFRCCGSAAVSLLEIAAGQVDGYVGIGESTWDVMAILPILAELGVHTTVDWAATPLEAKLKFACGTPGFLDAVSPIMPYGTVLAA